MLIPSRIVVEHTIKFDPVQASKLDQIVNSLALQGALLMKVADFVAANAAALAQIETGLGNVSASVTGIQGDVAALKEMIETLQDELDNPALDEALTKINELAGKVDSLASDAQALDDLTPGAGA